MTNGQQNMVLLVAVYYLFKILINTAIFAVKLAFLLVGKLDKRINKEISGKTWKIKI